MKPFDASLNALIDAGPADWVRLLAPRVGLTPGPAEPVDTDLSVTAQSDKAFRLLGPPPAILHVELQSTPRLGIPADLLRYNVLLGHNRDEPVYSVVVLLRPKVTASDLTGVFTRPNLEFRYAVVRVWEESVESMLAGPATAPRALVTDEALADFVGTTERIKARLQAPDVDGRLGNELRTLTYFLGGLRYGAAQVEELKRRLNVILEDSISYQWVLEEGRARGVTQGRVETARDSLLLVAGQRFGPIPPAAQAAIQTVTNAGRLRRMLERVQGAADWDGLLATP